MRASLRKTVVASLAALAFGISTVAAVAPASAQGNNNNPGNWPHGQPHAGNHAAGGNWHGNGGGGGGHWHNGAWVPAAIGLGILGLAAGAAVGAAEGPYDDGPADDCMRPRPVYDAYGNYMGRRLVNVC